MNLSKNLYKLSGIEYGTCSNTYALDWGDGIALFDAGTHDQQFDTMQAQLHRWGLGDKPITHVFLTHGHFDHAGNALRFQQAGARIIVGKEDASDMETGGPVCLEAMFGRPFPRLKANETVCGGETYTLGLHRVEVLAASGHSRGSMAYLITTAEGFRALCTGDLFAVPQTTPGSEYIINVGWVGGPGFDKSDYLSTVDHLAQIKADVILTGHWCVLFGDSRRIMDQLARQARQELG